MLNVADYSDNREPWILLHIIGSKFGGTAQANFPSEWIAAGKIPFHEFATDHGDRQVRVSVRFEEITTSEQRNLHRA